MSGVVENTGFWFAIGIVVGLAIEFGGKFFSEWWYGPRLQTSMAFWPVTTGATIPSQYGPIGQAGPPTQPITVKAYRFPVKNTGRRAATNVAGTLEFNGIERRVSWYEGSVPSITINAFDRSFLDVYGVVVGTNNQPTKDIVMPTERGWDNLTPATLGCPLVVTLRITAANARATYLKFTIEP